MWPQKVGALMTDYAEKHGYTLVLDAGDQQSATVLYAVPSTDITKAIIDAYNQKSGIPAPPAQGAGGPACRGCASAAASACALK